MKVKSAKAKAGEALDALRAATSEIVLPSRPAELARVLEAAGMIAQARAAQLLSLAKSLRGQPRS